MDFWQLLFSEADMFINSVEGHPAEMRVSNRTRPWEGVNQFLQSFDHRFPDYRNVKPYVTEIKAGDILVLPPKWFHKVWSSEEFNMMATAWCFKKQAKSLGPTVDYMVTD